ncbi:MAG: enoyl-CoA hydratase-related protein [bacterium]|nr:enoyl-CoA hydratase-related protein [bacterium]
MKYNFKNLLVEIDNHIAKVTINRPQALNALSIETIEELQHFTAVVSSDDEVQAIIITGSGDKAFVAGADINELRQLDREAGEFYSIRGNRAMRSIELLRKPVIAAINGYALGGGCELAMACHIRIASDKAKFGQPEVNLGLIPGFGGTQRLTRLVGMGRALQLLLTGETISAEEAYRIGLVNQVVPHDELMNSCYKLLGTILSKAPIAVQSIIKAVYGGQEVVLDVALNREAHWFGVTCGTEDMKEGTAAFLEKRKPNWSNK